MTTIHLPAADVLELLEAADTAVFLSRQQDVVLRAVEDGDPQTKAWIRDGLERAAAWDMAGLLVRGAQGGEADQAAWDEFLSRTREFLAWRRSAPKDQ